MGMQGDFLQLLKERGYQFGAPAVSDVKSGREIAQATTILAMKYRDGVLVAGRSLSATHEAQGATRVMPPSFAMGEAAGAAAALAVRAGVGPREVSIPALQKTLVEQGAWLGEAVRDRVVGVAAAPAD